MALRLSSGDIAFGTSFAFLFSIFAVSLDWDLPILFGVAMLCVAVYLWISRHFLLECLFFLAALGCGVFYFHFYHNVVEAGTRLPFGKATALSVLVSDEPQPSEKFLIVPPRAEPPFSGAVTIFAPPADDRRRQNRSRAARRSLPRPKTAA